MMRILTAALLVLGASSAYAADKVTLMLNWYVYSEHAPFFYGKAKGFYSNEGIDLDIQEGRGSAITTQAVAAGTVDFGYVDVPTMFDPALAGYWGSADLDEAMNACLAVMHGHKDKIDGIKISLLSKQREVDMGWRARFRWRGPSAR